MVRMYSRAVTNCDKEMQNIQEKIIAKILAVPNRYLIACSTLPDRPHTQATPTLVTSVVVLDVSDIAPMDFLGTAARNRLHRS